MQAMKGTQRKNNCPLAQAQELEGLFGGGDLNQIRRLENPCLKPNALEGFSWSFYSVVLLLLFTSCSTTKSLRIPNPNSYELKRETYYVSLNRGWTYTTRHIRVERDSVFFNGKRVKLSGIKSIETKRISPWGTVGFIAGATVAAFLFLQTYIAFSLIHGHSASK